MQLKPCGGVCRRRVDYNELLILQVPVSVSGSIRSGYKIREGTACS